MRRGQRSTPAGGHRPVLLDEVLAALDRREGGDGRRLHRRLGRPRPRTAAPRRPGGPADRPRPRPGEPAARPRTAGRGGATLRAAPRQLRRLARRPGGRGARRRRTRCWPTWACRACRWTTPSAASPTSATGRSTCAWTARRGRTAAERPGDHPAGRTGRGPARAGRRAGGRARGGPARRRRGSGAAVADNGPGPRAAGSGRARASGGCTRRAASGTCTPPRGPFRRCASSSTASWPTCEQLLRVLPAVLRPGGRAAIISFHSGEDRLVKAAFRDGLRAGVYAEVAAEPIRPSFAERTANPRSRSAKLRWARCTGEQGNRDGIR